MLAWANIPFLLPAYPNYHRQHGSTALC